MFALTPDVAQALTVTAVIGGIAAAIALILKARPEAGQIAVTAAQGAVIVQTGVIDSLVAELARVTRENTALAVRQNDLEAQLTSVVKLRERIDVLEAERIVLTAANVEFQARAETVKRENDVLRARVTVLEGEIVILKNGNGHTEPIPE